MLVYTGEMKARLLIVLLFFFLFANVNGQSLRLSIKRGGTLNFYFNSLKKYQNGITYTDYTQIAVAFSEYDNTPFPDSAWQIQIKAFSATIDGGGSNTLPIDRIRISTTDGGSTTPATYSAAIPGSVGGWFELTTVDQVIVQDGPEGAFNDNLVNISWDCGTVAGQRVEGYTPDYYVVDIDILLDIQ